jgi:hypothetical protein
MMREQAEGLPAAVCFRLIVLAAILLFAVALVVADTPFVLTATLSIVTVVLATSLSIVTVFAAIVAPVLSQDNVVIVHGYAGIAGAIVSKSGNTQ